EHAEAIAEVALARGVTGLRLGHQLAERAFGFAGLGLPVQAVLLAGRAQQPARIGRRTILHRIERDILALGVDDREQRLDDRVLIATDLAGDDLLAAGLDVEIPARLVLDQGERAAPSGGAGFDVRPVVAFGDHLVILVPGFEVALAQVLFVAGGARYEVAPSGPEDRLDRLVVVLADGFGEGGRRFL